MRSVVVVAAVAAACAAVLGLPARGGARSALLECSGGFTPATIDGAPKCLRAGEFCSPSAQAQYARYGFGCVDGHLRAGAATTGGGMHSGATAALGRSVLLASRTRVRACVRGPLPDRACSPGAYYSGLSASVICSAGFRTSTIRDVPQEEKFAVEREYGMPQAYYGRTIEIDHVVPLELGGSNEIANLFPEPGAGAASYHVKDRLENRLHDLVCAGRMSLAAARRGIASDWETLYRRVFAVTP